MATLDTALWQARFHDDLATQEALPHLAQPLSAALGPFFATLTHAGVPSLDAVSPAHVEAYRSRLFEQPWHRPAPARLQDPTVGLGLRPTRGIPLTWLSPSVRFFAVRAFLRYLHQAGHLATDAGAGLAVPPTQSRRGSRLDVLEAESVLLAPDTTTPLGQRDRAVLELLYRAHLEPVDLRGLQLASLTPWGQLYTASSRRAGSFRVVLEPPTVARLEAYLKTGRPQSESDANRTLFLTADGHPFDAAALQTLVREAAVQAGLAGITPAALRNAGYERRNLACSVSR